MTAASPRPASGSFQPAGLRQRVPLLNYTTWKVGGAAEWFAEPAACDELIALARWAGSEQLPLQLIGAGSNLLISDEGLDGLVICNRRLQGSRLDASSGWLEAQAGEPLPSLARRAAKAGLSGLEWAVGIPGTAGGAAVMNAGAQGGCTAEWLETVTVLDPAAGGEPFTLKGSELQFAYRHSRLQLEPLLVLSVCFRLSAGHDPAEISRRTTANLQSRTSSQPYHQPSGGSVFRNPEPLKAGRLIEDLGLKGLAVGGAMVSPLHANFIVNTGEAKAGHIDQVIQQVQAAVRASHQIDLHPEIKRLGHFAP
ncbi:UDP-N-acetylmuramate dehydrogenase [Synechococcus sp. CS-602]|uniref:UDP-N-acetylmuramate dehydrogenase n=1 Tax=Synechococcaceae TaxID=1890426 RepID=UPI0008FF742C|nr:MULTISPECIES: UDP-N-acetylmuramate dehydrogenase [Synechococcaceae]MCT4364843.1 UDP-N-acetylmuramate dehydrogenase [Candidatus Regnicoccus frigidus MAG-AL1]MCT0203346.1 UDP-N-acetylmuramate dehydrogenase [Synechococcus sp. CS-603]MCT0203994.1 UDP-N-acetylmuramate dehydrogenase [Synechococcus sp. CS-602]MCT0246566.1 UDP-N-acetylmuramate dehydrogenase [Synechococcus sp. CS-601]MCT4368526.1 UDP-N-acetylmuramate dehydrogenase [Candidatus Regnicoccus frigidus MAG-AL2]